jgi:hypothetical protein
MNSKIIILSKFLKNKLITIENVLKLSIVFQNEKRLNLRKYWNREKAWKIGEKLLKRKSEREKDLFGISLLSLDSGI